MFFQMSHSFRASLYHRDRLLVADDECKVHVHTHGQAFREKRLVCGALSRMKIDNSVREHQPIKDAESLPGSRRIRRRSRCEKLPKSIRNMDLSVLCREGLSHHEEPNVDYIIEGGMNSGRGHVNATLHKCRYYYIRIIRILFCRKLKRPTETRECGSSHKMIPQGITAWTSFSRELKR